MADVTSNSQSGAPRVKLTAIQNNRNGKRRVSYGNVDLPLFIIIITLLVMGIVMMFSASYAWAIDDGKSCTYYAYRQLEMAAGGMECMFIANYFDYHNFQKLWLSGGLFLFGIITLVAVLFIGTESKTGVRRWLDICISFQPSEVVKFA